MILGIAPTSAGCAFVASASAAHSHITPCVDDPAFSVIDLVLGSGIGLALVASETVDKSPAWLLVPGVFLTSGLIGSITAYQCRHPEGTSAPSGTGVPVAPDIPGIPGSTSPSFGNVEPSDPSVQDATPAELGLPVPDPAVPPARLQLPSDYVLPDHPAPPGDRMPCSGSSPTACPAKQSCLITENDQGYCVPDR